MKKELDIPTKFWKEYEKDYLNRDKKIQQLSIFTEIYEGKFEELRNSKGITDDIFKHTITTSLKSLFDDLLEYKYYEEEK